MIFFWIALGLLVFITLLVMLAPFFFAGNRNDSRIPREALNKAVYADRVKEIELEAERLGLSAQEKQQLITEAQQVLLADVPGSLSHSTDKPQNNSRHWMIMVALAIFLAVGSGALYWALGSSEQIAHWQKVSEEFSQASDVSDWALADIALALRTQADDERYAVPSWLKLAQIYAGLDEKEAALAALSKAYQHSAGDPATLLTIAQRLAALGDNDAMQRARQVVAEVLRTNPQHQGALLTFGFFEFNQGNYQQAITAWRKLLAMRDPNSEGARLLERSILQAESKLNQSGDSAMAQVDSNSASAIRPESGGTEQPIRVSVRLADDIKQRISANQVVFVFAKASQGPPMPLAAIKTTADKLPGTFELSTAQAMMPEMSLAGFDEVFVEVRVSQNGTPTVSTGDFFARSQAFNWRNSPNVSLIVDQTVK